MNKILLFIFLFIHFQSIAQNIELKGKIIDSQDKTPLIGVSILLISKSNPDKKTGVLSDTSGSFKINIPRKNTYSLSITYIGYQTIEKELKIEKNTNLGILEITSSLSQLGEVNIAAKQVRVEQKGDTLSYNASAYKVNQDATAEDLVKKMSGITIENGQVKAQGENVKKITLDGKEFFGDDVNMALKNLPADIIDKIQVFDRLSEQAQFTGFNDGNTEKAINITTKSGRANGQFGKVYGGYGSDDRYTAGGSVNYFKKDQRLSLIGMSNNINQQNFDNQDLLGVLGQINQQGGGNRGQGGGGFGGGNSGEFITPTQNGITNTNAIGVNYSDSWLKNKVKFTGSYFFNQTNNENITETSRKITAGRTLNQQYEEDRNIDNNNFNHRLNLRFDYTIDKKNSILFTPRISFQGNEARTIIDGKNFNNGTLLSSVKNNNFRESDGYRLGGELMYRHRFTKAGRTVSLNFSVNNNTNNRFDDIQNLINTTGNRQSNSETFSDNYSLRTSFTETIKKKNQLEFSHQISLSDSKTDKFTYRYVSELNNYSKVDSSLSNIFKNDVVNNRIGLNLRFGGANDFGGGRGGFDGGGRTDGRGSFGGGGDRTNMTASELQKREEERAKERGNEQRNKFSGTIGLNFQNQDLIGRQTLPKIVNTNLSFNNLLPNAYLRYQLNRFAGLRFFYRTQTQVPSISQLQAVPDISNPLFLRTGNQDLKQEYSHNLSLRFNTVNLKKAITFFGFASLNLTNDFITNATYIAQKDTLVSGILLRRGGQITKPVNLDGNYNLTSSFSLGIPVSKLKSNLNFNAGLRYTKTPGLINNLENVSDNYVINGGISLSSNISEYVDFTASYFANKNIIKNIAAFSNLDNNFYFHTLNANFNWQTKKGFVFNTALNQYLYTGLSDGFNQNFALFNASIAQKLFKKQRGELKVTVFDIFGANNSITRNITETYIEDVRSLVLNRYFMMTFTYNIKNFR
jgi:hypothetical protein